MRRTAKVKAAAVAATAIAAAGQAGVAAAQATLPAAGPCRPAGVAVVTWRNGHSGRYLTVRNASGANGAEIQTTSAVPNRNRLQECWLMDPSGSRNGAQLYGMINEHSFKCADYFGRLSSRVVILTRGHAEPPAMRFLIAGRSIPSLIGMASSSALILSYQAAVLRRILATCARTELTVYS